MKRIITFALLMFLVSMSVVPCQAINGKLMGGIVMTVVGLACASSGFQTVTRSVDTITPITYTWTNKEVDEEWDFNYRYDMDNYTQSTHVSDVSYSDPNVASIAYTWTYNDSLIIGTDLITTDVYFNHHITYQTVTYSGTKNITIHTTYSEMNSAMTGAAGVALLSVGVNQIIGYFSDQSSQISKRNRPELKFGANPGKVQLMACVRY